MKTATTWAVASLLAFAACGKAAWALFKLFPDWAGDLTKEATGSTLAARLAWWLSCAVDRVLPGPVGSLVVILLAVAVLTITRRIRRRIRKG